MPIYDHLLARGWRADAEYSVIGERPVQFLPPSGDLKREAIDQTLQTEVDGVTRWVMRAEYRLQTGRAKDHVRILQSLEQDAVDQSKSEELLKEFNPADKRAQFESLYLEDANE